MIQQKQSLSFFLFTTAAIMLAVLSACIAVPLAVRPFYYAHVHALHLSSRTGWSVSQIKTAYNEMMDYCLFGGTFSTGDLRWSQSGLDHFNDCAILFRLDFAVLALSLAALLACWLLHQRGLRPSAPLGLNCAFWSGSILAGAFALIAALAATNFDRAFVLFHTLFFPGKDNWIFNPATDEIISILPQVFFRNCAILIVALLFLCCLLLMGCGLHKKKS